MQTPLDDLNIFCTVANCNSLYQAANHLGMPHSTVSRRVANLETSLEVQLIIRTTRQMRLTDKGQALYSQCQPLLRQLNVAVSESLDDDVELKGLFKITMPTRVGLDYMGQILMEFAQQHPALELNIELKNENADMLKDNIDLAFRVGPLVDSSAIAQRLWDIPFVLVAHKKLIAKHTISLQSFQLRHLAELPCVVASPQNRWLFESKTQGQITISPKATLQVNDLKLALDAAQQGLGFAYIPDVILRNNETQFDTQNLVQISGKDWRPLTRTLFAVYTTNRSSSRKIKAIVDYVKTAYAARY